MKKIFDNNQEKEIVTLYLNGENTLTLSRKYKVCDRTIANVLIRNNIKRRTGGHIPPPIKENYFDIIDTETKAYFLGLISADGSVHKQKNTLVLALELIEKDKYLIENLCKELNFPLNRIHTSKRLNRNPTSRITIYSNRLASQLNSYGIISGKCKTLTLLNHLTIGKDLFRHYLRGIYDGDGSVGKTRLSLVAGNKLFLEQVKTYFVSELILTSEALKIYQTGLNTWTLHVNRSLERRIILNYLYSNSNIFMSRKALYASNSI